jgi:ABC-type polysaccharide/polyol phosphate export permease
MADKQTRLVVYDSCKKYTLVRYLIKMTREMKLYRYAYFNFVTTILSSRYRRSFLGFLWTLISPLINLTVLAVIFSVVFKQEFRIFGVYVFSALTPWTFISGCMAQSPLVLINAETYLKKVYVPKIIFPLTLVSVEGINFFFSIVSIYILFLLMGAQFSWVMLLTPVAMLITAIFVLGLTILLSIAHLYFRDVSHINTVVVGALFFALPIMYPMETIPPEYQIIFSLNPFFHFMKLFRVILYEIRLPMWQEWLIPLGIALGSLLLGCFVLMKRDRDLVFRL